MFKNYLTENSEAFGAIDENTIEEALKILRSVRDRGATLWVAGNGGSSATASHAVADLVKTVTQFGSAPLKTVSISEQLSLFSAISNDVSFEEAFSESLRLQSKPDDALLSFSVSGTSPNILRAHQFARTHGLKSIAVIGEGGTAREIVEDVRLVIGSRDYQVVENGHVLLLHYFVKVM
jgi:D-sedoheptulose 7-phosphate isomerase